MEGETVATLSRRETLLVAYIEDGLVATKPLAGGHPCRTSTSTRLKVLATAARPWNNSIVIDVYKICVLKDFTIAKKEDIHYG